MRRPFFWHQGLFLQPHHFQMKDRYDELLLTPLNRFLNPHFWGIAEIEIQQAALGNYSFNLESGKFLFPDMTYVVCPDNAKIQPRSFERAWEEGGKTFSVYLGLKKWNDEGENVTVLPNLDNISGVNTRFVTTTDPEEVQDLHQNSPPAQIKKMYYLLQIFWETEKDLLGDYELIQLANLERDGDEIKLSEQFIAPCISISGSETLDKLIREIRDQIASRGRQLEAYKRERGIHSAEFGARDMVYLLALMSLNRYVPLLTHLTETKRVHPWHMYAVLRQLIGELSSFSGQISVTGELEDGTQLLFGYDHRNLWECFSGAKTLVTQLLEFAAEPEYIIQLLYDGTYFTADLPPMIFEGRNQFYLVFETETDPKTILQNTERIAKLGTRESLPILIARALPGIKLEHLPIPPQELPRRAHSTYFKIDHHGDNWTKVQKEKNLALYWDAAPQDLKVQLMTVGRT
jgi:type VI secretion system protein ImpJ